MKDFLKLLYASSLVRGPVGNKLYRKSQLYWTIISLISGIIFLFIYQTFGFHSMIAAVVIYIILCIAGYIYTGTY